MAHLTLHSPLQRSFPVRIFLALAAAGLTACSSGVTQDSTATAESSTRSAPSLDAGSNPPATASSQDGQTTKTDTMTTPQDGSTEMQGKEMQGQDLKGEGDDQLETITLATGCFWCSEAVLEQVDGVRDVVSGYTGGTTPNPSYKQVCTGNTGHAEAVKVDFDPKVLPLDHLLAWFWKMHDPTTLNRQGADVGTQYRSAIFYSTEEQREAAIRSKQSAQSDFSDPIVTEITPAGTFYPAEDYHQDYYRSNKNQGYCRAVIAPKLSKLDLEK